MIITNNEAALRVKCSDVLPDEIGPLREQLERELKRSDEMGLPGIGLAAPQIGIAKNMAIVRVGNINVDLINCKIITGYDKAMFRQEGCLSFPGRYENTMRFQEIVVAQNAVEPYSFVGTGLFAVVVQHELDHTSGILLPDNAIIEKISKVRPNDPCPCGKMDAVTGRIKKYKKCCG